MSTAPTEICQYRVTLGANGQPKWTFHSFQPATDTDLPPLNGDAADGMVYLDYFPVLRWKGSSSLVALQGRLQAYYLQQAASNIPGLPTDLNELETILKDALSRFSYGLTPSWDDFMRLGIFYYMEVWLADLDSHILNEVLDEPGTPSLNFRFVVDGRTNDYKFTRPVEEYLSDVRFEPVGARPGAGIPFLRLNYSYSRSTLYRLITGWESFTSEPFYAFFTCSGDKPDTVGDSSPQGIAFYRWPSSPGKPAALLPYDSQVMDSKTGTFLSLYRAHIWDAYQPTFGEIPARDIITSYEGAAVLTLHSFYNTVSRIAVDSFPSTTKWLGMYPETVDMENALICGANNSSNNSGFRSWDIRIQL